LTFAFVNWRPTERQLSVFGLLCCLFLGGAVGLLLLRGLLRPSLALGLAAIAVVAAVLGIAAPRSLRPIYLALVLLTLPVGFLLGHVLFFLLYFVLLFPTGVILRRCRHDPLRLRGARQAASLWVEREGRIPPERYFKQF
jgi:hypothetical protein